MNRLALSSLVLGLAAATPAAFAQTPNCPPGSWLCADVSINGGISGNVQVGPVAPIPPQVVVQPPQRVYMTPPQPQPVVYVQPAPRVWVQPAPRVYVQPPPVVVYQPQQPVYYYQQPQQYQLYYQPGMQMQQRSTMFGLMAGGGFSYLGGPGSGLLGEGSVGFRVRGRGHWGFEGLVGVAGGRDYNGDNRLEVPVALSGMVYFNPQHAFQVYGLFGVDYSWASLRYTSDHALERGLSSSNYQYLGGHAGLGFEWHLGPVFALWADARGFVRGRIDGSAASNPEFSRQVVDNAGTVTTQSSNTSMGVLTQAGVALFF